MQIIWLGHGGWRIEVEGAVLLVDPWLTGNPMFPEGRRADAIRGATHIVLTHGHNDHTGDMLAIAKELGIPLVGIPELMGYFAERHGCKTIDFNKGGTVDLNGAKVTMVNATHSSSMTVDGQTIYAGTESGYVIAGEGRTIYFSGDTDVMADMKIIADLHAPDIGILCAGGHYTMDMTRAAYAAKTFFDFSLVLPSHYRTFPLLAQDASGLQAGLPGVTVHEPEVLTPVPL
ncbi:MULTISPECIES: metal-dependent hydrolase [unclassified Haematobacter]|uniref:metal-dependent hydrolase n=1 Tax=unclassified Haematobacter TaxID=2640585 RepID=UPI0025BE8629|nr:MULTISPECIES: metal-dependent hydrolase [unclassified Haematobacter]